MKRKWIVLLAVAFLPMAVNAQMAVADVALQGLVTKSGIDQYIYYGQQIASNVEQIFHLAAQAEHMANTVKMQMNNLSRIGEIRSWDDFMDWHNRQLYLERRTEETIRGMNVSIGNKNYSLYDVEGIKGGLREQHVEFWEKEFTEEQKREMWLGLGLTSSNYAYVQTWRQKEDYLAQRFLTATAVQNEESMNQLARDNDILNKLTRDVTAALDDKMGEKELAALQTELLVSNNVALNNIAMTLAEMQEMQAVDRRLRNTPVDAPPVSNWPRGGFRPLAGNRE